MDHMLKRAVQHATTGILPMAASILLLLASNTYAAEEFVPAGPIATEDICGPIALGLIVQRLGLEVDMTTILESVDIGPDGTSLAQLAGVARGLGLTAQGYKLCTASDLSSLKSDTPAIVHLNGNHFAAVWDAGDGNIWVADYPKPLSQVPADSLATIWDPRVLVIHRNDAQFQAPRCANPLTILAGASILFLAACLAIYHHAKPKSSPGRPL